VYVRNITSSQAEFYVPLASSRAKTVPSGWSDTEYGFLIDKQADARVVKHHKR
jgi:hypothetical protein